MDKTILVALGLAETASEAEALATIKAMAGNAAQVEALSKKLHDIEQATELKERDDLIKTGQADGKIPPALVEWAKTQPVVALRAYLAAAPKLTGEKRTEGANVDPVAVITAEERVLCARFRVDPKEYAEHKAKIQTQRAGAAA